MSGENVQETEEITEVTETETESGTETDGEGQLTALDTMSPNELKAYVKTLRKENAKTRTEKQATKKELEEFQAWKDSQKSELEKATERAATLERENVSLLKTSIALGAGLTMDDVEFISGETPEEMKASATKLASRVAAGEKSTGVTNVFAGTRGAATSEAKKDPTQIANDYMATLIWGNGR